MRLQLDSSISKPAETGSAGPAAAAGSRGGIGAPDNAGSRDSIALSGPSAALNQLAADRTTRIAQLSALVQSGSYQVSGAAIGGAIVAQAFK